MAWCGFGGETGDLVENSAKWQEMQSIKAQQLKGDDGMFWAAYRNDVVTIQERLQRGDNIDGGREGVQTPVSVAAEQNCVSVLSILLKAKADVNRADQRGISPIYAAAQAGNAKCVRMLVYAKADVNQAMVDGSTPAFVAAHCNNPEALMVLVLSNSDVERQEDGGFTPLMAAAKNNSVGAIKVLLGPPCHCNPGKQGPDGVTAVQLAAQSNFSEATRLLSK